MGDFNQQFGITRNDTGEKVRKLPTFPGTKPEETAAPTTTDPAAAPTAAPTAGDPPATTAGPAPAAPAQETNPIKQQMMDETAAKAAAAPSVDAPITSDANEELVQAGEIAAATRARAVERYQVDLPDEVYNVIRDRIANAPDPDAEGYRWATAWRYTQMYDISMEDAYTNLEYYNKALYGDVRFTPKDNFAAVSDAFALGINTVKRNSIGISLGAAIDDGNEIERKRLEKELAEVNADNASLADNQPRAWYVEALKFGAQSAPFTGMVALAGITGGALAPAAATAAAFATSMSQAAGGEYLDMREDGVSHDTARALSLVSGSLQAVVEIALGNTASLITKATGAQTITANLFKRMNVTKSWTRAARVLGEYIGETGEEGLEEALQSLISSGANNLAAELEGAGVDRVTAEEAARDAWESWKGGVLGSLVLGAAGAGINAHTEIKDALALKEAARSIDSKEAFIASTGDSKAFEGLSDADRVATQEKIWTAAAKQRDARVSEEAAAIAETGDFTGETPLVDGETDTVAPRGATQRTAEGKLYVQEGSTVTQNDDGSATRVLKVGNPNEETSFNRYGYIKYREYDDHVVVDDFRMSPGREDIRAEFFDEFSSRVAGKSIDWEPTNAQGRKLKETILAGNPAGSAAGLQYYAADLDPGTVRGRVKLDAQIKKYWKNINETERALAVELLETHARRQGQDLGTYLDNSFSDEIFTNDKNTLIQYAQKEGVDPEIVKGGVAIPPRKILDSVKALIYVTEKSDFSTYTHEIAHVFRQELAGEQLVEAEKAFGVIDGIWTREKEEKFAYGFSEYLREGKAPTSALQKLYQEIADFMFRIYKTLAARVEVSPDIRKVYDELLAGTGPLAEVAAASKQTTGTAARAAETTTTTADTASDTQAKTGPERDEAGQDGAAARDDKERVENVADASKALLAAAGEAYKTIPEDMFFQDERVKKLLENMTKDELIEMLHSSDSAAGIPNYRAYRRDIEDEGAWPVQVSLDADSLKWVNDNMGHSSGDMMLREIGEKLAIASKDGSVRVYHKSGDEFLVQAKTVNEYVKFKIELDNLLERVIISVRDDAIGGTIVKPGIFLSDGIDNKGDMDAADKNLEPEKSYREHHGERASRGKVPPGVRIDYDTGRTINGHAAQSFFKHREKELKKLLKREKQNSKPVNQFTPERTRELRKIIEDGGEILFQSTRETETDNAGTFNPENPSILFQTETVELENETGSLMVMHNTSADSLVKSVQANGMPMPSIAIMRPEQGFTQFGGISLIGPKEIIDPEQNDSNRVYNRDVWSPTVPEPEYTIKKKKLDALDALFTAAKKYAYNGIGFENVNATDYNTPERMARYFARSANVKAAYLIEKGIEIPDFFQTPFIAEGIEWANTPEVIAAVTAKPAKMPTIEEVENPDYDPTKPEQKYWNRKTIFNIYKPDGELYTQERTIEEAQRDVDNLTNPREDPELRKAIDKAVWEAYTKNNTKGITEEARKDFIGNGPADHPQWFDDDGSVSFSKYDKIERAVYQTQRGVKLRDTTETRAWIDERAPQEDVETWLREKAKDIYSDPFLKINGEKVPYTAETMVRKMKAQGDIGAQEGFAGIQNLGKIAAMAANKLESIAEIRSEGESLQSADDVKKYEDETLHEVDETYLNIAAAGYKYKNADLFTVRTDARQALFNYVSQMGFDIDRTVLARKLRSLDFTGDDVVDAAVDLINALKDAPIDYIEAKPKRVVSLAEFSIAVIPENTDPSVRAMIEGQGLNVYTYESNSQDDRLEVVRKVALENPDILFQTEEELVRDAATFDSWQEFMEYYEEDSWTRPEDAAVPENADAQWYQTVWEKAHGIVTEESLNEQEVAERATADQRAPGSPDAQDALWLTEMQSKPEALDEFLKRINDIMTYKDQFGPADQGELDSRENVERLKRRIITEMRHGSWISNATRVSAGRALTDRARRQLISLMRGAVRDYRSLYADIMEDDEWSVALADSTAGKLAKIADPNVDYTEITPERRRKIAERIANAEIAKKLKSGDLTMEEAERHIAFLKDELKGAAARETSLEKELQEEKDETSADYRRLSDWQTRQLLKLKDELDVARAKHESRSDKTSRMIERGQAITKKYALETQQFKANYDTIFRKFSDLSRTMEISGAVKTALARRESLYEARMENARLRDQISAAREARKIRTGLVKHVMRRVSFDRVNYDEARKILAIQRKFFPALEKGVNKWIGTEGPYLREFYSQWKTSDEFREEFVATAEKGGMSRKKLNRALKLLEKDYDAWTRSEREELLAVLPKEYPFEELNLAALEKEREESLQLDETSDEFDAIIREALPSRIAARIESRPFAEWTIEEMEELAGVVDGLYTAGKRMREAKKVAQQTEAERIRGRIIEAVKDAGFEADDTPEERKRKQEKLDRTLTGTRHVQGTLAADAARESFRNRILKNGYADANVRRVARILDGGRDGVNVGLLYDQEDVAFNEKHRRIRERSRKIAKAMDDSKVTAEDLYRKIDIANFWGPGAAESFTVDDLLFVLKADEDEQSRRAVMFGNFLTDTERQQPGANQFNAMEEYLTSLAEPRYQAALAAARALPENVRQFADAISADYGDQYERMNEASIAEFNAPVWRVEHYVPLMRRDSSGDTNENRVRDDLLNLGGGRNQTGADKGMTQKRIDIAAMYQRPVQMGLYSTWADSVKRTEHFIAYAPYVRELNRVYKNVQSSEVRGWIKARYGDKMTKYIDDYINECANPDAAAKQSELDRIIRGLRGRTAPAYLAWKVSGVLKQFVTSPAPYLQFVSPAEYASAAFDLARNYSTLSDAIREKSVFMDSRVMDPLFDLVREQQDKAKNELAAGWMKITDTGMKGLEFADWSCVAPGWLAVYRKTLAAARKDNQGAYEREVARLEEKNRTGLVEEMRTADEIRAIAEGKVKDEADLEALAIKAADDATRMCQPSSRVTDLAPMFKSREANSEALKVLTQFQTSLNVIWQNIRYDLPAAVRAKEYRKVVGIVAGYVAAGAAVNLMTGGAGDDDDDALSKAKRFAYYSTTQFTDAVPIIGDMVTRLAEKTITGDSGAVFSDDVFPAASKLFQSAEALTAGDWDRTLTRFGEGVGYALGAPVSGVKEIIRATDDPAAFIGRR